MKRALASVLIAGGAIAAAVVGAPQAAAYPVGPWSLEGPCKGKAPQECPMSPSQDGLTWAFHGDGWNYDKYGNFVCMSSAIYCAPVMLAVRALPPTPIGAWINPGR